MLRRTSLRPQATSTVGDTIGASGYSMMKHKWNNEHLLARSTYEKEQKKRVRQARGVVGGNYLNGNKIDNRQIHFMQSAPMTSRLIVKRGYLRNQGRHWTELENNWMYYRRNNEMTHHDTRMHGGFLFQQNWSSAVGFVDDFSYTHLKHEGFWEKNRAIEMCESWGLKMTVIDSEMNTGPRYVDVKKRAHPLYAENFPYIGENRPLSNRYHGDAEFSWMGNDRPYDYSVYGAKTKSAYNYFRPSQFDAIRDTPFYNNVAALAAVPASAAKQMEAVAQPPKAAPQAPKAAVEAPKVAKAEPQKKKEEPVTKKPAAE